MTVEYQLTKKKYYETFIQKNENQPLCKGPWTSLLTKSRRVKSGTTYRSFA